MELWRAQAGSGKTEAVVALIAETVRAHPLDRVWVVLPSNRQRAQFRVKLLDYLSEANLPALNVELFNFYSLNRRLLNLMRLPVRSLRGGARQAVLRRIAARETLQQFGTVAATPGFSHAVGQLISELKQTGIEPDDFTQAVRSAKDDDLARLYEAYQTLLRLHNLVDTEGEAWLALESLRDQPAWNPKVALLAVDGFDQFTGVQAQLIQHLSRLAGRTVVTLTAVEGREDGVGRRFTSAAQAFAHPDVVVLSHPPHPQPAVRHLLEYSFRYGASSELMPPDAARTLAFIEAHSPSAEAIEVMRLVKKRLVLDYAAPDDIMIVLRDWARYQPALTGAAKEFGVPVSLQAGAPLSRHPIAAALTAVLSLPAANFAFEAVIDALRSPYVLLEDLPPELLSKVEQAARAFGLRIGRDSWQQALDRGTQSGIDYQGRETPPILTPDEAAAASDALNRLFNALPLDTDTDSVWAFVSRIEELIGVDPDDESDGEIKLVFSLFMAEQARLGPAVGDDIAALQAIKDALRNLLLTEDLLAALTDSGGRNVSWREFMIDFNAALADTDLASAPDRSGRVLLTTATDARGSAHKHVFILGLSEGVFPAPLAGNPLYLDSEIESLKRDGRPILRSAAERSDDESLFFELIAQARESLTFSRPSMNSGQVWPPSLLWNAITELIASSDLQAIQRRARPGQPPSPESAASLPELASAIFSRGDDSDAQHVYVAQVDPLRSAHVAHAGAAERARYLLARTGDSSSAPLQLGDLAELVASGSLTKVVRPDYPWSASTLNSLGYCAYQVFADKLLGLDELEDITEGADASLEGTLMHRILEGTYRGFQSPSRSIAPENRDAALELMRKTAADVFKEALDRRELIPSPIWSHQEQVLVGFLSELIARDFSDESPITSDFGTGPRWTVVVESKFGDDPLYPIEVLAGETRFSLTGTIDRIDCIQDGDTLRLVIVDYKRSLDIKEKDIIGGRSSQLILYREALSQLLNRHDSVSKRVWFKGIPHARIEIAGGLFLSLRSGKSLHTLHPAKTYNPKGAKLTGDALTEHVLAELGERIASIRAGDFRPLPSKPEDGKCSSYCVFSGLCRVCEMVQR